MTTEYDLLNERVELIESILMKMQRLINGAASIEALNALILMKQQDIVDLQNEVVGLRSRIERLETATFKT